jgi:hypothetical protein
MLKRTVREGHLKRTTVSEKELRRELGEDVEADAELTEQIDSPERLAAFLTSHARDLQNRIKNLKAGQASSITLESLETTLKAMSNGVGALRRAGYPRKRR